MPVFCTQIAGHIRGRGGTISEPVTSRGLSETFVFLDDGDWQGSYWMLAFIIITGEDSHHFLAPLSRIDIPGMNICMAPASNITLSSNITPSPL